MHKILHTPLVREDPDNAPLPTGHYRKPIDGSMVDSINEQFAIWVAGFEQENPGVQPLVQRAIQPDLSTALNDLAAQGLVVTL
jgi:hypothetical protein